MLGFGSSHLMSRTLEAESLGLFLRQLHFLLLHLTESQSYLDEVPGEEGAARLRQGSCSFFRSFVLERMVVAPDFCISLDT